MLYIALLKEGNSLLSAYFKTSGKFHVEQLTFTVVKCEWRMILGMLGLCCCV